MPKLSYSEEKIVFDGYWWGTATQTQKLGYVQGFIDGAGNIAKNLSAFMVELITSSGILSEKDAQMIRLNLYLWNPYDHTFGYYIDRIDGFYRTTLSMRTLVQDIMLDLMTPME